VVAREEEAAPASHAVARRRGGQDRTPDLSPGEEVRSQILRGGGGPAAMAPWRFAAEEHGAEHDGVRGGGVAWQGLRSRRRGAVAARENRRKRRQGRRSSWDGGRMQIIAGRSTFFRKFSLNSLSHKGILQI
jgi:hypothetical protein